MPGLTFRFIPQKSNLENIINRAPQRAADAVHQAALDAVFFIRTNWSGLYPPASLPGQPPAIRTGTLNNSIRLRQTGFGNVPKFRVYAEAFYGKYLELGTVKMAPRPFLYPALARMQASIASNIRGVFKP